MDASRSPMFRPARDHAHEAGRRLGGAGRGSMESTAPVLEGSMEIWIVLIVIAVIAVVVIGIYNGLIGRRNRVDEALSQIQVQLKRRHDLIPNLVNAVKGYMQFEQKVLTDVTNARAAAVTAGAQGNVAQVAQAENQLTGALRSLFAVVENYPELKAN